MSRAFASLLTASCLPAVEGAIQVDGNDRQFSLGVSRCGRADVWTAGCCATFTPLRLSLVGCSPHMRLFRAAPASFALRQFCCSRRNLPDETHLDEEASEERVSVDKEGNISTNAEEVPPEDALSTYAFCGVEIFAAQSRLHDIFGGYSARWKIGVPLHAFETGSIDCFVCGLIVATVTTWTSHLPGVKDVLLSFTIEHLPFENKIEMEISILEPKVIKLDVFRTQGM